MAPKPSINLMRGWPAPDLLPAPLLSKAAQHLLADPAIYTPALQYGPSLGYQPLRKGLASWLKRHYQLPHKADPSRICITGGASQSVANLLQVYTDPAVTKAVWAVAPCYHLVCPIFEDAGFKGRLRAAKEDDEGIDLNDLEAKLEAFEEKEKNIPEQQPYKGNVPRRKLYRHIIYVVTTCSNPSGKTMSLRRREGLVLLARKYNALVISDDVYDFLQWPINGELTPERPPEMRVPRLSDVDFAMGYDLEKDPEGFGNAISNASFSKIAGPGVRTGWVEGSAAFVYGLGLNGSTGSGGAASQLTAAILSHLVNNGEMEKHIETVLRPSLQSRHRSLMDAIKQYLLPHGVTMRESSLSGGQAYGGYFVWLTVDIGLPATVIAEAALEEENLIIGPGRLFQVHGDENSVTFDKKIRLCFSWEPEEVLVEAARRFGELVKRMKANKGHYGELAKSRAQGSDFLQFK